MINRSLTLFFTLLLSLGAAGVFAQVPEDLLTIKNEPATVSFISQYDPYIGQSPNHGTITLVEDPVYNWTLTYTPDQDYLGPDDFMLVSFPFGLNVSFRRFAVQVQEAEIIARHDLAQTTAGTTVTIPVTDNDFVNVGSIELKSTPVTNAGTSRVVGDSVVFTPAPGFVGLTDLNYVICTVGDVCDLGTVSINVLPTAAVGRDTVRVFTKRDQPQFIFAETGATNVAPPLNGSLTVIDGVAAYEPDPGFAGDEWLTYRGTNGDETVFHVTVLDQVDNVFAAEDRAFTPIGAPVTLNVLHNDLYSIFSDCVSFGTPRFGTLTQTGPNGEVRYTPPPGWTGVDRFTYTAMAPGCVGDAESETVYVFVSDYAPVAGVSELTTPVNNTLQLTYDVPNGAAEWRVVTQPTHGTVSIDPAFNTLEYTPHANASGQVDQFNLEYCLNPDASGVCAVSQNVVVRVNITADNGESCDEDDCVWPGDTNRDGVVDLADLLPIGRAMGQAATPRLNGAAATWGGQYAENWDRHLDGLDIKHVDANGDQVISHLDTQVVMQNLGLGHRLRAEATLFTSFELSLLGPTVVQPGDLIELDIILNDNAIIEEDVYGFIFPFQYDVDAVETGSVNVFFDEQSWISYDSPILSLSSDNTSTGVLSTSLTRTNGLSTNGFGSIGKMYAIIEEDVYGFHQTYDQEDAEAPTTVTFGGGEGRVNNVGIGGGAVEINPITIEVRPSDVNLATTSVDEAQSYLDAQLKAFPNPASEQLTVHLNGGLQFERLVLTDITGRRVLERTDVATNHQVIPVADLPRGVYTLSVFAEEGVVHRMVEVLR